MNLDQVLEIERHTAKSPVNGVSKDHP